MKNVKFLLSAALVFLASAALAQDFSAPQYAKWGATPEEREQNILNSNFLKESCDNRDYDAAAHYLKGLIDKIPDAAESIYQRGAVVYKNKINRAKSVAEKNMFIDSLMLMYDMRAQYFGDQRQARQDGLYPRPEGARVPALQTQRPQGHPRGIPRGNRGRAVTAPTPRPWWLISRTSARITRILTR